MKKNNEILRSSLHGLIMLLMCAFLSLAILYVAYNVVRGSTISEYSSERAMAGIVIALSCLCATLVLGIRQGVHLKRHAVSVNRMQTLLERISSEEEIEMASTQDLDTLSAAYCKLAEYHENWRVTNRDIGQLYKKISEGILFERIDTSGYSRKYVQIPETINCVMDRINRLIDEIPVGISILDEHYRICYLNKMLRVACGLSRKSLMEGRSVQEIGIEKKHYHYDSIKKALEQGHASREETNVLHEGREHWIDVVTLPCKPSVSGKKMVMQLITEQTELYDLKRKADSANAAKSRFLSSMSHEIRTPINAILGYAQLLQESITLSKSEKGFVDTIRKSGNHLLTIINDVLEISKIEEGRMEFHHDNFNLCAIIQECVNMIEPKVQEKGLELSLSVREDVPYYVSSDQVKIRQMILNVLSNAVKFTERGGIRMDVCVDPCAQKGRSSKICIDISDTGFGIEPKEYEKVFDIFKQTASGRRSSGGTGLGMPISRTYARHLGGDLCILRSEVGRGTTFRIEFLVDVVEHTDVPEEKPEDHRTIIGIQGSMRILVVDDNLENRSVVGLFLGKVGIETIYAQDGREAISKARSYKPDMIFMDLSMPIVDGFEATKRIRNSEWGKHIHIIAMTANVLNETVKKVRKYGFADYIIKPFVKQQIFDVICKFCDVEYVYETQPQSETPKKASIARDQLPEGFEETIKKAVFYGDFDKVVKTVEELDDQFSGAKQYMLELADNFDGKAICGFLEQSG